jgi:hypothetical protein
MTKLGIKNVESHSVLWYKNIQFKNDDVEDFEC